MNIAEIFIRRPVMTTLVMMAILLFGIIGYRLLPVSDLPNVDFPTIQVRASLPGANPDTMASAVATPLERQFSTIAGLDSMNSTNTQGNASITLQFTLDRDIDAAAQDVQAMIAKTQSQLPRDMPSPPSYQKVNPADQPILYMALKSPTLPLSAVDEYVYESFIHPVTILFGLPSAGFGALVTLLIFKMDLNIYAFVGIIMLVGIVKKNAIMMIDFALEAQRKEGRTPHEAIYQGCLIRIRPIMMTTMSALMGTLPIALGFGAGAESRRPLGLAVVGGLVFSQLMTLYITPVFYLYMESFQQFMRKHFGRRAAMEGETPLLTPPVEQPQSK